MNYDNEPTFASKFVAPYADTIGMTDLQHGIEMLQEIADGNVYRDDKHKSYASAVLQRIEALEAQVERQQRIMHLENMLENETFVLADLVKIKSELRELKGEVIL